MSTQLQRALAIHSAPALCGIKASNLSRIIKDTEKEFGFLLFIRTNKGLIPTENALQIFKSTHLIKQMIEESFGQFLPNNFKKKVLVYIEHGLEINGLENVCPNAVLSSRAENADILIGTQKPLQSDKMTILNVKIGNAVTQDLWISAKDSLPVQSVISSIVLMFQH